MQTHWQWNWRPFCKIGPKAKSHTMGMVYLPIFGPIFMANVGKIDIHGSYGSNGAEKTLLFKTFYLFSIARPVRDSWIFAKTFPPPTPQLTQSPQRQRKAMFKLWRLGWEGWWDTMGWLWYFLTEGAVLSNTVWDDYGIFWSLTMIEMVVMLVSATVFELGPSPFILRPLSL